MIDSLDIMKAVRPRLRRFVADKGDDAITLIEEHTSCDPDTIGGWLATSMPLVQPLIKLWYLLEALGFASAEMEELEELNQYLGRLFGLGVVTMQDLQADDLLKVAQQTAVHFLRGQGSMKLGKKDIPTLKARYDARLTEKLAELKAFYDARRVEAVQENVATPSVTVAPAIEESQPGPTLPATTAGVSLSINPTDDPAVAMAMLIGIGVPLAHILAEGTPEQRARFKAFLGTHALPLHDFVDILYALRTEAALTAHLARGK